MPDPQRSTLALGPAQTPRRAVSLQGGVTLFRGSVLTHTMHGVLLQDSFGIFFLKSLLLHGLRNLTFFLKGEKPQHDLQRIKVEAEAEEGLPP